MGVLDAFRGRGIGSQLLGALRDLASIRKIPQLALDVWRFNSRARAFYQARGFQVYQEKMWVMTDGVSV
jgi:GNAT superfamily N-acetyltransferase